MLRKSLLVMSVILSTQSIFSYEDTGFQKVTGFGCQADNHQCYVEFNTVVGSSYGCPSQSIRWDGENTLNVKTINSMILTAIATDKKIQVVIGGCYAGFPSPAFVRIQP